MTTVTRTTSQKAVDRMCSIIERSSNKQLPKHTLTRLNKLVEQLNNAAVDKDNERYSDKLRTGGHVLTVLYKPNFSPAFRTSIRSNFESCENGYYSVENIQTSYLSEDGLNYNKFHKDSHDMKVLASIQEDYIAF